MVNLIKAELLRLVSRRLVWITVAALVAVAVLQTLLTMGSVAPLTEADYVKAQHSYEIEREYWEQWQIECDRDPDCADSWDMSMTTAQDYLRYVSSFEEFLKQQYDVGSWVLLFVVVFIAAVVTAADFGNGALATQLTFTPRRLKVFVAKLVTAGTAGLAVILAPVVIGGVVSTLVFMAMRPSVELQLSADAFGLLGTFLVAGLVLTLFVALAAMLVGSTLAALGVTGAVVLISYIISDMLWWSSTVQVLLPTNNFVAVFTGEYRWWNYYAEQEGPSEALLITFPQGLFYFAIVSAFLAAAAAWRFERRDLLI